MFYFHYSLAHLCIDKSWKNSQLERVRAYLQLIPAISGDALLSYAATLAVDRTDWIEPLTCNSLGKLHNWNQTMIKIIKQFSTQVSHYDLQQGNPLNCWIPEYYRPLSYLSSSLWAELNDWECLVSETERLWSSRNHVMVGGGLPDPTHFRDRGGPVDGKQMQYNDH